MNEVFWNWLSRRNPARLLIALLIALAVSLGWLGFRQTDPVLTPAATDVPSPRTEPVTLSPPVETSDIIPPEAVNPFASKTLTEAFEAVERERARQQREKAEAEARKRADMLNQLVQPSQPADPKPAIPKTPAPPKRNPSRPPRTVTYQGLLIRPDGTRLGLVSEKNGDASTFYAIGDALAGQTVQEIGRTEMKIGKDPGVPLPLGQAVSIEDRSP